MKADEMIDKIVLERLQMLMKDKFPDALQIAIRNTSNYITAVGTHIDAAQWDEARAMAHKIASSAGSFGLLEVVNAARKIEYQDGADIGNDLYRDLRDEFAVSVTELNDFIQAGQA